MQATLSQNGQEESTDEKSGAMDVLFGPMLRQYLSAELPQFRDLGVKTAREAANEQLGLLPAQRVEIWQGEMLLGTLPRQHFLFPALLHLLKASDHFNTPINIALVGPTGTGKTRMCINAAEALNVELVLQPFNPHTTKSELMGYMDANGRYVESPFYKAFKEGKLYIADEFDAANPAVATTLNAAISNRMVTFPNGETVAAHPNFRAIFVMNTYGMGADDRYTGRSRLDMATLDRFVYLYVPIDEGFEAALVGIPDKQSPSFELGDGGRFESEREILHLVVSVRGALEKENMRYSVSPRATIHGAALHRAGFGKRWIEDCCIFRGMPKESRDKIMRQVASRN
ncbi:MAG: AAA family ATPase [Deltaproteobacteria bacterium]|nr:AAA family ATPase [Deltaproteobacteria bacterium]